MSPRVKEAVAGKARTDPSITLPGPGIGVKPAVRGLSTRKSPKEEGRGVQRLGARVVPVTLVTQIKMTTRNLTPRTAPTPLAATTCHLHHPEVHRPGFSPPEVCPQGGEEGVVVVEETSTEAVVMWEDHLEDTGLDPTLPPTVDPQRHQPQPGSSTARRKLPGLKTWVGEEMEERRKTRQLMQVNLKIRGPILHRRHCPLQPPLQ